MSRQNNHSTFVISPDRVGQLSGGERRRLQLLQILALAPNFLVLDEPSNDLDITTLAALEEYLTETFEGCLVVVSHDNFFVNRVCEHCMYHLSL